MSCKKASSTYVRLFHEKYFIYFDDDFMYALEERIIPSNVSKKNANHQLSFVTESNALIKITFLFLVFQNNGLKITRK